MTGPVVSVASVLALADRGVGYPVYMTLFCAGFLLPPAVVLLLARRLGMDGAGWKRLGISALPFLAGIVLALAAPYTPNSADTSWLGALAGAWIIFLSGFASTASGIPGHPRRGTVPRKTGKLLAIGLLLFGYSVISFFVSLF